MLASGEGVLASHDFAVDETLDFNFFDLNLSAVPELLLDIESRLALFQREHLDHKFMLNDLFGSGGGVDGELNFDFIVDIHVALARLHCEQIRVGRLNFEDDRLLRLVLDLQEITFEDVILLFRLKRHCRLRQRPVNKRVPHWRLRRLHSKLTI